MTKQKARRSVPLQADLSVSAACGAILRHNFDEMLSWEGAARSWEDAEGVHQMRVSCRRMRAALSAFRSAVPKAVSGRWSEELGWAASQLGPARDLDVFITEGLAAVRDKLPLPGYDRLLDLAQQRRAVAYEAVRTMLDSDRYAELRQDFPHWLETAAWEQAELSSAQRHKLDMPIGNYARKLLDRLERRVLEAGTDVDKEAPEKMHRLRIEFKKLRYGAEFFAPIIPGLDDFIGRLKGLQDLLGTLNDVAVTSHLLDDIVADEADAELVRYSGAIIGWRTRQALELLDHFEHRWHEFLHAKHPWWHGRAGDARSH